jgi:gamma-glutamylcyclotransferase (GGCT)/AIG2-like uncharacterized protein YtfP
MIRLLPVFVYGTLKRGEVRAACWPREPVKVEEATVRGALFDLGDYPALVPGDYPALVPGDYPALVPGDDPALVPGDYPALVQGDDLVGGELWHFAEADLPAVLARLDRIEGYHGHADDLYRRMVVECQAGGGTVEAWTYHFARAAELASHPRIPPDAHGICRWSRPDARL